MVVGIHVSFWLLLCINFPFGKVPRFGELWALPRALAGAPVTAAAHETIPRTNVPGGMAAVNGLLGSALMKEDGQREVALCV